MLAAWTLLFCRAAAVYQIRGYQPTSSVVADARIDLDVIEMAQHMRSFIGTGPAGTSTLRMDLAEKIYEEGGHACSRAEITMPPLPVGVKSGDIVSQSRSNDWPRRVTVLSDAPQGSTSLVFLYTSIWRPCFGGGSSASVTTGAYGQEMPLSGHCLDTTSPLLVNNVNLGTPTAVQPVFHSLRDFSVTSPSRMAGTPEYDIRRTFYGFGDYAHQFIENLFHPDRGQPMFGGGSGLTSFTSDIIQKSVVFMSVWMEVVHQMESAVGFCRDADYQDNHRDCNLVNCEGTAQHMWDKAVAYYAGSKWESDTEAVLLDALANRLCRVFGTCSDDGLSMVSQKIFRHFQDGQTALKQAECSNLVSEKNGITSQLYVPLIQDLLRVAHALATERDIRRDRSQGIFFAKILQPKLATCDQAAADLVARNMLVASSEQPMRDGFAAVTRAVERTYTCLGLRCEDVGGILQSNLRYKPGAEPCGFVYISDSAPPPDAPSGVDVGVVVAIVLAAVLAVVVVGLLAWRFGFARGKDYGRFRNPGDGPERGIAASMASPLGGTGTTEVAGEIVPREEQPEAPQAAATAKDKV